MADYPGTLEVPASPAVFKGRADTVFAMLADPRRRRLLATLAGGIVRPASKLAGWAGRRVDATLEHLTALRDSGLIIAQPDPQEGRHQLHSLSLKLTERRVENGQEMDFSCCVLRLRD